MTPKNESVRTANQEPASSRRPSRRIIQFGETPAMGVHQAVSEVQSFRAIPKRLDASAC